MLPYRTRTYMSTYKACTQREKLSFGKGAAHRVGILGGRRVAPDPVVQPSQGTPGSESWAQTRDTGPVTRVPYSPDTYFISR